LGSPDLGADATLYANRRPMSTFQNASLKPFLF
jgi:hypothetical protein